MTNPEERKPEMSRTPIKNSNRDGSDQKRERIPGLVATFSAVEPLILGAEGEEYTLRKPIIITPTETTRMHIMHADGIPLNRLKVYLSKYPESPLSGVQLDSEATSPGDADSRARLSSPGRATAQIGQVVHPALLRDST